VTLKDDLLGWPRGNMVKNGDKGCACVYVCVCMCICVCVHVCVLETKWFDLGSVLIFLCLHLLA
jgi:hypothetical protein